VQLIAQGYHAAPLHDISARVVAQDAARSAGGFEQYRTARGYDQVLASLEHGLSGDAARLQLGRRVTRITWSAGSVQVETTGRDGPLSFNAKRCLVTVSLGVLQAPAADGGITFEPEPSAFRAALTGLGMGMVERVVLRFARAPWVPGPPGFEPVFAHVPDAPFDTLWREARSGQAQITAWSGGPRARELQRLSPQELIDAALASLARAAKVDPAECQRALIEAHHHDFARDPLTRGAYSYVRPDGEDAAKTLAQPWEDTLFLAGEALDLQYPGTVAGALGSGEHAARRIVATWPE
jgi:monoamine oxidase